MRNINRVVLVIVFLLAVFCVDVASAQTTNETVGQRVARLKAEEAKRVTNETPTERLIRLRAEQIELEEAIKKAKLEVATSDSPAMRKARAEFEKAEKKIAEAQNSQEKAVERSGVAGCDGTAIWVHPDAVPYRTINSSVRIRVFNPESVPVNIEDPRHGVVVRGLCPGGSLTLFRARSLVDPDYLQFRFIARATLPDGRIAIEESQSYNLSSYDWRSGRGRQEYDWTIQLRMIQQVVR